MATSSKTRVAQRGSKALSRPAATKTARTPAKPAAKTSASKNANAPLGRVTLRNVRLAFPNLRKATDFNGDGNMRFTSTGILEPGSEAYKTARAAVMAVATEHWGAQQAKAKVKRLMLAGKCAMFNGNDKSQYEGFEGNWAVNAATKESTPPTLKDPMGGDVPREKADMVFYAGCYVYLYVDFYVQDASKGFGERINASLRGIQFAGKGDPFSGGAPASDEEFETIEGAEGIPDMDDDDDDDGFDGDGDDDDGGFDDDDSDDEDSDGEDDDGFGDDDDDDSFDDDDDVDDEDDEPAPPPKQRRRAR